MQKEKRSPAPENRAQVEDECPPNTFAATLQFACGVSWTRIVVSPAALSPSMLLLIVFELLTTLFKSIEIAPLGIEGRSDQMA